MTEEQVMELYDKFEPKIFEQVDEENFKRICEFLISEKIDFIDELIMNYFDLFLIEYKDFVNRYQTLKIKYGSNLTEQIANDLNLLEELF